MSGCRLSVDVSNGSISATIAGAMRERHTGMCGWIRCPDGPGATRPCKPIRRGTESRGTAMDGGDRGNAHIHSFRGRPGRDRPGARFLWWRVSGRGGAGDMETAMGAERGAIAAWVASWDDRERAAALAGVAEKAAALRGAFGEETGASRGELLAGAVFLEYAERVGVCPLELHWILGDAAAASAEAVMMVRVQVMVEDAVGRREGRVVCANRRAGRDHFGRRGEGRERARRGESPSRGTEPREEMRR